LNYLFKTELYLTYCVYFLRIFYVALIIPLICNWMCTKRGRKCV